MNICFTESIVRYSVNMKLIINERKKEPIAGHKDNYRLSDKKYYKIKREE